MSFRDRSDREPKGAARRREGVKRLERNDHDRTAFITVCLTHCLTAPSCHGRDFYGRYKGFQSYYHSSYHRLGP